MATGDREGSIIIWDLDSYKEISKKKYFSDWIRDIRVSKDENTLYVCSADRTIKIINSKDGTVL
jgi:WD40 repeat protein